MTKDNHWIQAILNGDRDEIRRTFPWGNEMEACPQDSLYHAEGNVWIHTMMVLNGAEERARERMPEALGQMRLAAMFHDSAKPETTKIEWCDTEQRERVKQPNHAKKGADKAWQSLIDAGMPVADVREVAGLVLWHQRPSHILEQSNQAGRICRFVAEGGRWDRLLALCESDQSGRISPNVEEGLLSLELLAIDIQALSENLGFDLMAGEAPQSGEWRVRIGEDWKADPFYAPQERATKRLTIMSGLPGSGKSTWVQENAGDEVVISLDQIRSEFKRYKRNQEYEGKCYQEAVSRLRKALAADKSVIWDACNVDVRARSKITRLGRDYGADLRIISIDEPFSACVDRNKGRDFPVPDDAMRGMAFSREMVLATEAHEVLSLRDGVLLDVSMRPAAEVDVPMPA